MTSQLNVLFKSQQKDDKKEVLKFEIKGNENSDVEGYWYSLAGSIVVFNVGGCAADDVTGEFINMQRDSKKTVVKLAIKGDNEEKARELYRFADGMCHFLSHHLKCLSKNFTTKRGMKASVTRLAKTDRLRWIMLK